MKKNKALFLDIMLNDRYVCTLKYIYCPLFVNSIRNYIQTHQEEYEEGNSKTDSLSRKEANNGDQ